MSNRHHYAISRNESNNRSKENTSSHQIRQTIEEIRNSKRHKDRTVDKDTESKRAKYESALATSHLDPTSEEARRRALESIKASLLQKAQQTESCKRDIVESLRTANSQSATNTSHGLTHAISSSSIQNTQIKPVEDTTTNKRNTISHTINTTVIKRIDDFELDRRLESREKRRNITDENFDYYASSKDPIYSLSRPNSSNRDIDRDHRDRLDRETRDRDRDRETINTGRDKDRDFDRDRRTRELEFERSRNLSLQADRYRDNLYQDKYSLRSPDRRYDSEYSRGRAEFNKRDDREREKLRENSRSRDIRDHERRLIRRGDSRDVERERDRNLNSANKMTEHSTNKNLIPEQRLIKGPNRLEKRSPTRRSNDQSREERSKSNQKSGKSARGRKRSSSRRSWNNENLECKVYGFGGQKSLKTKVQGL